MRFVIESALVLGCTLSIVASAHAGAVDGLYANTVNELEDQDFETIVRDGEIVTSFGTALDPFAIESGDIFVGAIKIQKYSGVDPTRPDVDLQTAPDTFTAIFAIKAQLVSGDGIPLNSSTDTISFGALSSTEWNGIFGAGGLFDISAELGAAGFNGHTTGTMAVVLDGVPFSAAVTDAPPLTSGTEQSEQRDSLATFVSGGDVLWEFGFTGAGGVAATNEFWNTIGTDAEFPALILSGAITNRLAINVTDDTYDAPELVPHNHLGSTDFNFTGETQLQGKGVFQEVASDSVWPIGTDTNFYILPVPEPTSIVLAALGAVALAGYSLRRRKQ